METTEKSNSFPEGPCSSSRLVRGAELREWPPPAMGHGRRFYTTYSLYTPRCVCYFAFVTAYPRARRLGHC
jgi:hypothetical protein